MDKGPGEQRLAFVHVDDVPWTEVVARPPGVTRGLGSGERWP